MHEHLVAKGYVSILGDPCLFRKVLPDGGIIMACTYIDDVTYGVSSPDLAQRFLSEMRERFVIEEGEGKQVEFTYTPSELQLADFSLNLLKVPSSSGSVISSCPRLKSFGIWIELYNVH